MKCEKCQKETDGSYGSGRFCSRQCANSREFSEESNRKKSEANKKRYIENGSWGGMLNVLTEEQRTKIRKQRQAVAYKELMESDFESLSYDRKRKRVKVEQDHKCMGCGNGVWLGKKLTLEVDHKNGDSTDNRRDNLVALCPNCHSVTDTWRGRNKVRDGRWLPSSEIYELYKNGMNIRQLLVHMGFAAKGDNYTKVRRMIENIENSVLSS